MAFSFESLINSGANGLLGLPTSQPKNAPLASAEDAKLTPSETRNLRIKQVVGTLAPALIAGPFGLLAGLGNALDMEDAANTAKEKRVYDKDIEKRALDVLDKQAQTANRSVDPAYAQFVAETLRKGGASDDMVNSILLTISGGRR